MAKTKKQIIEDLKLVDIVAELLDARIPLASQNPDIQEIIKNKKRLIILNKCDLANEQQNKKWLEYFTANNIPAVLTDSMSGNGIQLAIKKIEQIYDNEKYENKGRIGKSIRIMILGIPNVGKSSFINRIAQKTATKTGNKPGVTKQKQWIRVSNRIELLDTPGVLWPKLNNQISAMNLAFTGTIKDDILQIEEVGFELLKILVTNYKPNLLARYKLDENKVDEIIKSNNLMQNEKILMIMNLIGKKRGAIISGGEINIEKVANIIIDDFRSGKLGKITLEIVENWPNL